MGGLRCWEELGTVGDSVALRYAAMTLEETQGQELAPAGEDW